MNLHNTICLYLGQTSLMLAAQFGNTEAVGILLEHGSNVNAKDEQGKLHTIIVTMSIYRSICIHLFICI